MSTHITARLNHMDEEDLKKIALIMHLDEGLTFWDIDTASWDDDVLTIGKNREYLVVDEEDRETKFEEYAEHIIEEIVFPEIPEPYRYYFDEKNYIKDLRMDGYGHALARYDGDEHEVYFENPDKIYFIYRQ